MKDLYLVGAGGMGREVLNQIQDMQAAQSPKWNIVGFLDDTEAPLAGKKCDFGVVGTIQGYTPKPNDALLMCIASPKTKRILVPMLKARGAFFDTFISPWAYLGRHNEVGEGTIIYGGFSMSVNVTIGNFVTLIGGDLGHDVVIDDYATISARCGLMGRTHIGEGAFMGYGSCVGPGHTIGDRAFVGIGAVVVRDVHPNTMVLGNSAREMGVSEYA